MTQAHDHQFGDVFEKDRHDTGFMEAAYGSELGATTWLAGAAVQVDAGAEEGRLNLAFLEYGQTGIPVRVCRSVIASYATGKVGGGRTSLVSLTGCSPKNFTSRGCTSG